MATDQTTFREKLDNAHSYPMLYMFKFIVPTEQVEQIKKLFPKNEVEQKPSSGGKYISTTIKVMVSSSDQIIKVYEDAKKIPGIISL